MRRPELKIDQILAWVDDFHSTTKRWPRRGDGRIPCSLGETWLAVDLALKKRGRGISHRTSLARLLHERRNVQNRIDLPRFSEELILRWADEYYAKTGDWPHAHCGKVLADCNETWAKIDRALFCGTRGLSPGSSLAKFLSKHRLARRTNNLPKLTKKLILGWAKSHFHRTGSWPTRTSGSIPDAPGETWARINWALVQGNRGFPQGASLAILLAQSGMHRNRKDLPRLNTKLILHWADKYIQRHDKWPTHLSGPIDESNGETWSAVHSALYQGGRGLPGGSSLHKLLKTRRPTR